MPDERADDLSSSLRRPPIVRTMAQVSTPPSSMEAQEPR